MKNADLFHVPEYMTATDYLYDLASEELMPRAYRMRGHDMFSMVQEHSLALDMAGCIDSEGV